MIAYIHTQGAIIVKEDRHLLVKKGADTCNTLFTYTMAGARQPWYFHAENRQLAWTRELH